ncbi:nucleotide-binding protein [Bradyrhizobium sp.]|uniref:nucleotide-binding protein n=1 Tax=Bradyrhizobium sp. TaxID=376 RepID=UPI0025C60661|nr:nucleotide-binding protein [Bradyrhizobium sp.]
MAALLLGMREGLNVTKYSTEVQRAEVRRYLGGGGHVRQDPDEEPRRDPEPPRRRAAASKKPAKRTKDNTVFVVHGRDSALRQSIFEFLRALGLHPLEWDHAIDEAKQGNPYVGDVLDIVMDKAEAIVVLFTPDDLAQLKDQFVKPGERSTEGKQQGQARPNVLFEAGLALGAHPKKTVMVQVGQVKSFSDIGGRHMVRLTNDQASRNSFANRLARICPAVNRIGNDWMHVGKFEPTEARFIKKATRGE